MSTDVEAALAKVPYRITNPERIPVKRYFDPDFFELEREHLWPHVWQMACRLEQIPEVGDYAEYSILDKSVIVMRTSSGVKAFLNACRHRGVRLVNGPGTCTKAEGMVCPFHGWRWNAEGENIFVYGRQIYSDDVLTKAEIDLAPVRIDFWAGCAFINFDDNAASLRDCLGPVADRIDARKADKLKMDWWCGTVLPTNWKLAMEAFQEGHHTMKTHPQLHFHSPNATDQYGPDYDGKLVNAGLDARERVNKHIDMMANLSEGMAGMVHHSEVAVIETLRDIEVPDDPDMASMVYHARAFEEIARDAESRGAPTFDMAEAAQEHGYHAVEFMFPHYFLLPVFGAMSSYRIRPLTPETCFFEIWSLAMRPDDETFDVPLEPTILPYNSQDFPEIPRQDYSNLPLQQLGLHNLKEMRLSHQEEGMISNYQRLVDGYLAGLDPELLRKAQKIVNCGFQSPIHDIGF